MTHTIRAKKGLRFRWHTMRRHVVFRTQRYFHGFPFILEDGWDCQTCHKTWY